MQGPVNEREDICYHLHKNPQVVFSPSRCLISNKQFNPGEWEMSIAFSSNGNQIVSGVGDKEARNGIVYIWCVKTGGLMSRLEGSFKAGHVYHLFT
jgi:WD40 repeat protein